MTPDLAAAKQLAAQGFNLIPVVRRLVADDLTPVAALSRLADEPHAFLFESVVGGERVARYSMLGVAPKARLVGDLTRLTLIRSDGRSEHLDGDPFSAVRAYHRRFKAATIPGLPRFTGGLVGYWGYDVVRAAEPLPNCPPDKLGLPDVHLMHCDTVLVFDHSYNHLLLIAHLDLSDGRTVEGEYARAGRDLDTLQRRLEAPAPVRLVEPQPAVEPEWLAHTPVAKFHEAIGVIHERIRAGDSFQVVLSQRLTTACHVSPFQVYRSLRSLNPSPYLFYLRQGDSALVGASPELLVRVEDRKVAVRPIAGTALRGKTPAEDEELARKLLADPKEIAEHTMLIDLGRNDVGRVCKAGTVKLTEKMIIERYSHVQHIVSHVEGELRDDLDALDALRACHPAGTVSGAPKVMSMKIIDELEPVKRGPYAGAVGYLDFRGNLDTCIALRTAILTPGEAHVQAGAGVVADSTAQGEFEETLRKARATLMAIARAGQF
jgi:anthranilate synthase component 1